MGCDIHIVIQRQDEDGSWRELPYQTVYNFTGAPVPVDGVPVAPSNFTTRNYDLFAILANVRNGVGFAGITTGEGWPSIAPGRGWPHDFSDQTPLPNPRWPDEGPRDMGDHSFTYVMLDELEAWPWSATYTTLYGVVAAAEYERCIAEGRPPREYSGSVVGAGVYIYTPASYVIARDSRTLVPKPYVRMAWQRSAADATGWPEHVIPWLRQLANGRPLRLIIGFDS